MTDKPKRGPAKPKDVEKTLRDKEFLELRANGEGMKKIASYMGISLTTAYSIERRALTEIVDASREYTEEIRMQEILRLEMLAQPYYDRGLEGHHASAETYVKIAARKHAIQGLDKQPEQAVTLNQFNISVPWGEDDPRLAQEIVEGETA